MLWPVLQKRALFRNWSFFPLSLKFLIPNQQYIELLCVCLYFEDSFKHFIFMNGTLVSFTLPFSENHTVSLLWELGFVSLLQSVSTYRPPAREQGQRIYGLEQGRNTAEQLRERTLGVRWI